MTRPEPAQAEVVREPRAAGRRIPALAVGVLAAVMLALVLRYAVNVIILDEWELVPMVRAAREGGFSPAMLFEQQVQHRLPFARGIVLASALATGWNVWPEYMVSLVLGLGIAAAAAGLVRAGRVPAAPWLVVLAGLLIFTPAQWENWLLGLGLTWFLHVLGALGAVAVLARWPASRPAWAGVALAWGAAFLSAFSISGGLLVWPACLPLMAVQPRFRRWMPAWTASWAGVVLIFLHDFSHPEGHFAVSLILEHPLRAIGYVLSFLGSPLSFDPRMAPFAGAALLGVFAAGAAGALRRPAGGFAATPWVSLGLWAGGSACLAAVGRLGFGVWQGAASRYTMVAGMFALSAAALAALGGGERTRAPRAAGLALVFVLAGAAYLGGMGGMRERHAQLVAARACLLQAGSPEDPCLRTWVHPRTEFLWPQVTYLRSIGWSVWAQP